MSTMSCEDHLCCVCVASSSHISLFQLDFIWFKKKAFSEILISLVWGTKIMPFLTECSINVRLFRCVHKTAKSDC